MLKEKPLNVEAFLPLAISVADTLVEIHQHHIIHKDINPSNLLWSKQDNTIKIIDFGI